MLPTAHKLLLNRAVEPRLEGVTGDVLVIGAGKEPYRRMVPHAVSLFCTDIEAGEGIDLVADAHGLPFPATSFDFLIAIEVFEHLHSPSRASAEILRVLRDGGEALVTVPFMFHVHGDPFDYNRFTGSGLEELFKNFSSVKVQPFGNRLQVVSDIVTTTARSAAVLRIINHLLTAGPLAGPSWDCPSGYLVELRK